ncbi:proteinase-activated receptor 1-like [Aplochiton taeniatus]
MRYSNGVSDQVILFLTSPLSTVLIPSLYTFVCLISVPLNAIAVVIFARRIRPMKPAVIYMLNLAFADLVFALLLPFKIAYHFNGNDWLFGPSMCRVVTAAFYCNMYCSVLLIACIAVHRLLAVVYPMDSLSWRSSRNAALACSAAWLLALAGSVPLVLSEQTVRLEELGITTCHDLQDSAWLQEFYLLYFPTLSCLLFFLPLLVTVVCYGRVISTLSNVPLGVVGRSRKRARAVTMAINVLVLFVVCFTPTNCLLLVHYLQYSQGANSDTADATYAAYLVCLCVGSVSCCLDPLVYYFGSSQCQRQLAAVLGHGKGSEGSKSLELSSGSSRTSSKYILKSTVRKSSQAKKTDPFQASLNRQYKKLLV